MANEKKDVVVEKEEATTKTTKTTKTKIENEVKHVDERDDEIAKLKQQNQELSNKLNQILETLALKNNTPQTITISQPEIKKYKVINLMSEHNVTELKTTRGGTYVLRGYEDFVYVTEEDYRDIVRKYFNLFAMGILTTDKDGVDVFEHRKINIAKRYLSQDEIDNLDKFSPEELVDIYKSLHPRQQETFIKEFLDGISAGKKKGFKDQDKIVALNKVYKNGLLKDRLKNAILKITE